jgi:hypothetical protein
MSTKNTLLYLRTLFSGGCTIATGQIRDNAFQLAPNCIQFL